jgi:soluble lytic murein transglycosylase
VLPIAEWTRRFRILEQREAWEELSALLDDIERRAPLLYRINRLGFLHARAELVIGEDDEAEAHFAPFLLAGDPFRPLALHHAARLAAATGDAELAASRRRELLLEHPGSRYWRETLSDHLEALEKADDPEEVLDFIAAVSPLAGDQKVRRDLAAARVSALVASGDVDSALRGSAALLAQSTTDDAAERAALALDRPGVLRRLAATTLRELGDAMLHHRQWQRAVDFYALARRELPEARGELDFAIGRARFFAEQYADAERLYRRAAANAVTRAERARDYFHAARAAQLRDHDEDAERLLGESIATGGSIDAVAAALASRIRLRVHHDRLDGAQADLLQLRRLFPGRRVVAEGAVAVAMGELAAGRAKAAASTLRALPSSLDGFDRAEVAYWRARAVEKAAPERALAGYLEVLRADVPTHFAYLARHRLAKEPLAAAAARVGADRRRRAAAALAAGDLERARRLQTDAVLLAVGTGDDGAGAELERLESIYSALPAYRTVLTARALPLPAFPLYGASPDEQPSPDEQLSAMGLFDETVETVGERYPLTPFASGVTRSVVYRHAGASRLSIQAVESLMEQVPDDYVPQLLPRELRELLYPRYFYDWIVEDAVAYRADPRLLLAIMREESRFNPRAKSSAAARGLMQLLLTTARQVAEGLGLVEVTSEDLYDPRLVTQLGAKYLGDLLAQFDGDRYAAAAAYNAGPAQARLWKRLAPAEGDDYFLSTVGFAETRHYIRKVLNSYERYGEIYQGAPPSGGMRAEP